MRNFLKRCLQGVVFLIAVAALAVAVGSYVFIEKARTRQTQDRVSAAPAGGQFVDADDARLFVQQTGTQDAPVAVFIHGTGSWSETWRASMEKAASLGYRAVAIDMPPFGFSVPPSSGDYSRPHQAKRLLAALDGLGIRHAVFVAHSFGAAPAMEALFDDPKRADALILVDAALGLDSPQTDGSDNRAQRILRNRWVSESVSAAFLTNPAFTEKLLRSFVTEKDKVAPQWIELYRRPLSLSSSYKNVALWLPELLSDRGMLKSDDRNQYAGISYPVTLVWGETDSITPLSQAESLRDLIPGAKLTVLEKAGHIPQIEEPDDFLNALSEALIKTRPAT